MKKRVLSILLVVCLIVSLLPVSAFADEVDASGTCGENVTWTLKDGVLTISGTGAMEDYNWDSIPWRNYFDTIERIEVEDGVTNVGNYAFSDCTSLESIILPDGLRSIGKRAFAWCWNLADVTLPDGLESIDEAAFFDCNSLRDITIPEGVTDISYKAFYYCNSLSSVSIPKSVTSISQEAFECCYSLSTVNYAGTVAQWEAINVADGNNRLITANINCTDGDITPHGTCGVNAVWTLKDGVLTISGTGAMDDYDDWNDAPWNGSSDLIKTVVIEDGVTSIGSRAFYPCYNLTGIMLPDSVTRIGESAFADCSSLNIVDYAGTVAQWEAISIAVGNNHHLITARINCIDGNILPHGTCGENVTWKLTEDGTLTISGTGAMEDYDWHGAPWDSLGNTIVSVIIEDGVTSIGSAAFFRCGSILSVSIPESVTSIGDSAFNDCGSLESIILPDSLTSIGSYAFSDCTSLESIILPDGLNSIGEYAFAWCCSLTDVTLPNGMESIDNAVFYDCDSLKNITIPVGARDISYKAFYSCDNLASVSIPESVTSIGEYAFDWCHELNTVDYAGTVAQWETISVADGNNCLLTATIHCTDGDVVPHGTCGESVTWKLDEDGTLTITGTGAMEDYDWGGAPWYSLTDSIEKIVIEDGVTRVGNCAFESCESLGSITIPDSVDSIGDYAFNNCTSFSEITLPEKLSYIGEGAFCNCANLKDIVIPDGVATIKVSTFASCSNLVSASISEATTAIEEDAFWDCTLLSDTYYSGTKAQWDSIKIDTGNGCLQTTVIHCIDGDAAPHGTFGDNITWKLENNTLTISGEGEMPDFYSVQTPWSRKVGSITSVIVEDGVTNVGNRAFINFDNLKRVALPNSVKSIGDEAFSWCYSLENITIPEGVRDISYKAFNSCWSLSTVSIPESVTSIGESAFSSCDELESVNYGGTVAQWEAINIADGNIDLITAKIHCTDGVYVPHGTCGENVTWKLDENGTLIISGTGDMYDYTFNETASWYDINSQIKSIVIESGVTGIGEWAFNGSNNLNTVKISDTVKIVPQNAFATCWHLGAFVVDENSTCFSAVDGVLFNKDKTELVIYPLGMNSEEYTIPNGVKSIAQEAFELSGVQTITIPTSVTTIEYRAFNACDNLGRVNFAGTVAQWKAIDIGEENDALNNAIIYCTDGTLYPHGTCGENVTWKLDENGVLTISGTGDVYEHDRPWQNLTSQIMSVEIESGITSIGYSAFEGCSNLKSVEIPSGVRNISYRAFAGCMDLKSITIPDGVQRINEYTFLDCVSLETIDIPDTVTSVDLGAFSDCYKLTTVNYGGTVAGWGSVNIEDGNYALYSANVKCTDGVYTPHGTCGENITWKLDENGTLTISGKGDMEEYYAPWSDYSAKITSVVIEDGITGIGDHAFYDLGNIKSVTIPNSVTGIGHYAFSLCYWLETITLPDGLIGIGVGAFSNCTRLKSIVIPEGVEFIGDYAFESCHSMETVTLPDSLVDIGHKAFYNCTGLKAITIPAGVNIGYGALSGCLSLETIEVDKAHEYYYTVDGVLFNKITSAVVSYPAGKTAESYEIPNGVTTVSYGTFDSCCNLKSVSIPTSVTSIEECAFNGCDNLRDVYYSGTQAQWNAIAIDEGNNGFDCADIHCTDAVMHPHGICGDDLTWELKDGVLTISGTGDMYNFNMAAPWYHAASSIKSIELGSKVTSITSEAFANCKSLESITLPEGIISVAAGAFLGCDNLSRINISDNNPYYTSVDGMLFNKDKTEIIIYPAGKTDTVYVIPDRVTTISRNVFIEPTYLQEIVIHAGVTNIEEGAFRSCNLNAVSVDKDNEYYCSVNGALFSKDKTTLYKYPSGKTADTYQIPDGVNTIAYSAFWGSSNLKSVVIPESVTFIDEGAFISCYSLTDVYYTGTEEQWENVVVDTEFNYSLADAQMHFNYDGSHVHNYTEAVTAPTCTKEGYTTHTCACGDSYVDTYTDALGHSYGAWTQTKAPTCTAKGTEVRTCTRCNATETRDVEALGHNTTHHAAKAATCTEKGWEAYDTCNRCDYTTYKEIPATGHNYIAKVFAPTCTVKGYTTHTCITCGDSYTDEYTDSLGHDRIHHAAKAATCTEIGWEAYDTCSRCDYTTYKEIPATGHHHNAVVTAPTCTAKGYTTHTCACGDSYVDSYTDALGHSYGAWTQTKAPTCTAKGTDSRSCTRCGQTEKRDVAALLHDYENGACTRCGAADPNYDPSPEAPELKITTSAGHPKIYWNAVDGATKYWVYRSTDGKNFSYYDRTDNTSYTNNSTKIGTLYYYKVKAVKTENGKDYASDYSVIRSIRCKPAAPSISIYRANGKPQLKWSAVDGAAKYWIYRSTDGTNFKYFDSTTKTSYTNSGAASGTKYYYRVKAVAVVNGNNVASANSGTKSLMTTLATPSVSITTSNGKPKLTWKAVTGADKYYVYRSTDGKTFGYWDSTTKTSFTNSGAKKNTKYYYKVKAVCTSNSNANSARSASVSIKATK